MSEPSTFELAYRSGHKIGKLVSKSTPDGRLYFVTLDGKEMLASTARRILEWAAAEEADRKLKGGSMGDLTGIEDEHWMVMIDSVKLAALADGIKSDIKEDMQNGRNYVPGLRLALARIKKMEGL